MYLDERDWILCHIDMEELDNLAFRDTCPRKTYVECSRADDDGCKG